MHELLKQAVLIALISGGITAGVPLMFTALGETISERAGVLNIGLEGMMLAGAYAGFAGAYAHSTWFGFLTGMAGGAFVALFMVVFCVWLGLDQIVVGIALTLGTEGVTSVLHGVQFGTSRPGLGNVSTVAIPGLSRIGVLGPSLFTQPLLAYLGLLFVGVTAWTLRFTSLGLNLRAAGEKPEALDAAGVSVMATRTWATLSTGALAGLGGAYLSVVGAGTIVPFITHGQGFIGIVLAMLARGKPLWVIVGAFLFGMSLSLTTALQLAGINIGIDWVNMLPYVAVMLALILFTRRSYLPPALALPYVRGSR